MPRAAHALPLVALLLAAAAPTPATPPVAPVHPVTDHLWGRAIVDPYRWMEAEPEPQFRDYLHAEDSYARGLIDRIAGRRALLADIASVSGLTTGIGAMSAVGDTLFYLERDPGADIARLFARRPDGRQTLLVDPARYGTASSHAAIDQFAASPDARSVVVGVSLGGSEEDTLHILDTRTGAFAAETIDRAEYAAASWLPDGKSFFYARLPVVPPDTPPAQRWYHLRVFRHVVGTDPAGDPVVLDSDHLPFAFPAAQKYPSLTTVPGSDHVIAEVNDSVSPEVALFTAPLEAIGKGATPWREIASASDAVTAWALRGDTITLLTHEGAPLSRLVTEDLRAPGFAHAHALGAPPGGGVLTGLAMSSDAVWVASRVGATFRLARDRGDGQGFRDVALPFAGTITPSDGEPGTLVADPRVPGAFVGLESWVHPLAWYAVAAAGEVADTGLVAPFPRDLAPYRAQEISVPARDGTPIPVSIVSRRDAKQDGRRPTEVSAYGSYGISYDPYFDPRLLPWLDRGGVLVVAHVRGGGEKGSAWHAAGKIATKENTITDAIDVANAMVARGLTDHAHLAGEGTSAGGITIGGAVTQDPSLYRAALIRVGETDALRAEFTENGPSNIPESGSVGDRAQFASLLAMDSYVHVRPGVRYPAVLLTGGADDPRVAVWEPAKMTARLQAATASGRPVLFRVEFDAGHGIGSTRAQADAEQADEDAFLLWQMGEPGWSLLPSPSPSPATPSSNGL